MFSGSCAGPSAAAPAATRRRVDTTSLCPVGSALRVAEAAEHLVDRREVDLEAVPRSPQVEPPDAQPLRAGQLLSADDVLVEVADPVAQRLGVVGAELLDMLGDEAGPLEGQDHPGDVGGLAVGEDVALRERPALDAAVLQARDAVVEQPPAGPEHRGELLGVDVDLRLADVLDHPDRGDRVEVLTPELAIVLNANLDLVADPGVEDPLPRQLRLRLGQGDPDRLDAVLLRRVDDEAGPAAADVEHPLALL